MCSESIALWGAVLWISSAQCMSPLAEANAVFTEGVGVLASQNGMTLDEYYVDTADKWRLTIHRVRSPNIFNSTFSTPVLISHGLTCSSADFMMNPRTESLAFILADNGYDVFLVNHRANEFSNKKVTASGSAVPAEGRDVYESPWQFMAQYDMPAVLNFILRETGQDRIHLIGHSQGNPTILGFLANDHSYDDKIGHFVGLAPVLQLGNDLGPAVKFALTLYAPIIEKLPKPLFEIVMQANVGASFQSFTNRFVYPFCFFLPGVCQLAVNWFLQREVVDWFTLTPEFDEARTTVLSTVWPGGVTGINFYELSSQVYMQQDNWTRIDYRKIPQTGITNQDMYNSSEPPPFNFRDARVNTSLVFVKNDVFLGLETANRTIDLIRPQNSLIVDEDRFSHVDLMWSWKAACLVYEFVVEQFTDADDARGAGYVEYRRKVAAHLKDVDSPRCKTQDSV